LKADGRVGGQPAVEVDDQLGLAQRLQADLAVADGHDGRAALAAVLAGYACAKTSRPVRVA
jgi:hypothetical protein